MVKNVTILDTPGCASCEYAEELIKRIKKEEKLSFTITVKDITKHPEVLQKYPILTAPGIVIDGKLAISGKPGEKELRKS